MAVMAAVRAIEKRREDQFRQMRADETGREIRRKIGNVKETIGQDSKKAV